MELSKEKTYFAETDFRNKKTQFGIKNKDRSKHVYVIGKTGMGKSTLLENMAIQDIQNGNGMAFIDPHGKTAELLLRYIPEERVKDVIYFAPHDVDFPISFNVMEDVGKDQRHLVASGLMAAFKKIWPDVWSARMEYISNNILLALLEYPDSTILGVNRMLSDKAYRKKVVDNITDPSVKAFWVDEFAKYSDKFMQEAGASIQNKFGQFVSNPLIRNIIGQSKSSFDIREAMDNKKILIINLSKGRMGEINSNLIGSMLITKIYLAAMSRANITEAELNKLPDFYLYVDEFQSFVNDSFKDILSEARKYKLSLTIAHQYIEQVPEEVRSAVFGNVGTTIAFRVGPFDAEVLEKVFAPKFVVEDLVNLGFAQIYLTLMIDGVGSPPFSAKTLSPIPSLEKDHYQEVVEYSRNSYARPRDVVEEEIKKWHEPIVDEEFADGFQPRREARDGGYEERPQRTRSFEYARPSGGDRGDRFERAPLRREYGEQRGGDQRNNRDENRAPAFVSKRFDNNPVRPMQPAHPQTPFIPKSTPVRPSVEPRMSLDNLKPKFTGQLPGKSLKEALSNALKNIKQTEPEEIEAEVQPEEDENIFRENIFKPYEPKSDVVKEDADDLDEEGQEDEDSLDGVNEETEPIKSSEPKVTEVSKPQQTGSFVPSWMKEPQKSKNSAEPVKMSLEDKNKIREVSKEVLEDVLKIKPEDVQKYQSGKNLGDQKHNSAV